MKIRGQTPEVKQQIEIDLFVFFMPLCVLRETAVFGTQRAQRTTEDTKKEQMNTLHDLAKRRLKK